jgi:hypothetical protein
MYSKEKSLLYSRKAFFNPKESKGSSNKRNGEFEFNKTRVWGKNSNTGL